MSRSTVFAFVKRTTIAAAVSSVAVGFLGATTYEWAPIGKSDRIASPADCRAAKMNGTSDCQDVELPRTTTEAIEVAPGLTIVERVDG